MPRVIALEWDAREARVVVAATRGTGVALEQAFAIELAPAVPHGSETAAPRGSSPIAAARPRCNCLLIRWRSTRSARSEGAVSWTLSHKRPVPASVPRSD